MNLRGLFKQRTSSTVARERLQLILAHERAESGRPDLVITLREEILAVIAKHMPVNRDKVKVKMDRGEQISTLEVDIELPQLATAAH